MERIKVNGNVMEFEVHGSGEPLLLISTGPIADSFQPFLDEKAATRRFRGIAYHQRGQAGSPRGRSEAIAFEEHAQDAAALLRQLGVSRAHVAGHSTGAAIALQLALDQPDLVQSLVLLEPPLKTAPGAGAFLEKAGPAVTMFKSGDVEGAVTRFLSVVSGLDWPACRPLLERHVPGGTAAVLRDASNFFSSYLPSILGWEFGAAEAAKIDVPVLSVLGANSDPWFAGSHAVLQSWFPRLDELRIEDAGHLLHLEKPEPVTSGVAAWIARHPMRAAA